MWKAFPNNHAMIRAFQQMCRLKQKITAKVYEILRLEYSETISKWNSEKIKNKTHNFLGGEIQRQRVTNGTHHLLGGEISKKITNERMANGTHPCISQKTCPHCGKTCSTSLYGRWHRE